MIIFFIIAAYNGYLPFVTSIWGVISNKYFIIIYLLLSLALTEYGLKFLGPIVPKTKEDEERDQKFHPFRRNDIQKLNKWKVRLMAPMILPRYLMTWYPYIEGMFLMASTVPF